MFCCMADLESEKNEACEGDEYVERYAESWNGDCNIRAARKRCDFCPCRHPSCCMAGIENVWKVSGSVCLSMCRTLQEVLQHLSLELKVEVGRARTHFWGGKFGRGFMQLGKCHGDLTRNLRSILPMVLFISFVMPFS
jgi:hypothetical protein